MNIFYVLSSLWFIVVAPLWAQEQENWELLQTYFSEQKLGDFSAVSVVDIDNDKDLDVFIGTWDGYLVFYRNVSTKDKLEFRMENSGVSLKTSFYGVSTGNAAVPFWVDIDGDLDYDLFLGNLNGTIAFYKNIGTIYEPKLELVNPSDNKNTSYFQIDVGYNSVPVFCDIDSDGDYDLFIGERDGYINFYRNDGNSHTSVFVAVNFADNINGSYKKIDVGECSYPAVYNIDQDDDLDLIIGNWEGVLFYYRNDGTRFSPYFNEINYAISKKFSFNHYQSDGDARPLITSFFNNQSIEFIFSKINGYIDIYRITDLFLNTIRPKERIDINTRMANYYYEIGKEHYFNGHLIEAKLILQKGIKYKEENNLTQLINIINVEIQKLVNKQLTEFNKEFARNIFKEAVEYLLQEDFKKALILFQQLKELYKENIEFVNQYRMIAEQFENERKRIILSEKKDEEAMKLFHQGNYEQALKIWHEATALNSGNFKITENIMMCEGKIEERDAKQIITKLIKQAKEYNRLQQKQQAIEIYARIMEIGDKYINKKDKSEIDNLKNDIIKYKEEENIKKIDKFYEQGVEYLNNENYEKAIEIFKKIVFYNSCYKDVCEKLKIAKEKFLLAEQVK